MIPMLKKIVATAIIVGLVLMNMAVINGTAEDSTQEVTEGVLAPEPMLTSHAPIRINSDSEFNATNGVTGGSGTSSDPYIIDNWDIDATGAGCGIYIGNTTKHFVIRNCTVYNASNSGAGIQLYEVWNGELSNNTIYNSTYGVMVFHANKCNAVSNNVSYNEGGIYFDMSESCMISNNTINHNDIFGMKLLATYGNSIVSYNNISDNGNFGVSMQSSWDIEITNNVIVNNGYGVYDEGSYGSVYIYLNTFINNTNNACSHFGDVSWNTTIGNYWDDYTGIDADSDGIGDWSYNFTGGKDYYPLMRPYLQAYAGEDDAILSGQTYQFDGSDSMGVITNYTWSFIYNSTNIILYDEMPNYTFWTYGDYNVTLNVTNSCGDYSEDNMILSVGSLPIADAGGPYFGYTNSTVTLNASGTSSPDGRTITNYTWTINGTKYYGDSNPYLNISTVGYSSGIYNVTLNVTTSIGFQDENTSTLKLQDYPIADAGPDQYYTGNHTLNGSASIGEIINYTWTFTYNGTPVSLYGPVVVYNFSIEGTYNVTLTVTDGNYSDSDVMVIHAYQLNADAGPDDTTYTNLEYQFNGSGSNGDSLNYTWNFTDAGSPVTLYGETPTYNFTNYGVYNVTLTVTDSFNDTDTDWVIITVLSKPIADAGPPQAGLKGYYTLNGSGSHDLDGVIVNYTWTFTYNGSTEHLYLTYPMFYFGILGDYEITLMVTDDDGLTGNDTTWVNVTNADPVADAGSDITGKRLITFDGTGSTDVDGEIVNYTWNFTDAGTPVTLYGPTPSYDFNISQPPILVTLTVTDDEGGTDTDTMIVTLVFESPVADAGPAQGSLKGTYTLDGSGSYDPDGTITNWTWEFDYDGSTVYLYGATPTFDFLLEGDYEIDLNVVDDDWRTASSTTWVNITFVEPVAHISVLPSGTLKGQRTLDASLSTDADGTIVNYTWEWTYNSTTYHRWSKTFTFDFLLEGTYTISLSVTDDDGLHDETGAVITISYVKPVAVISGGDRVVVMFNTISFDGTGSTDADGSIVNYTWNFTYDGTNYTFYGDNFTFRFNSVDGFTNVTLTVTDDDGLTNSTSIMLEIKNPGTMLKDILLLLISLFIVIAVVILVIRYTKRTTEDTITG